MNREIIVTKTFTTEEIDKMPFPTPEQEGLFILYDNRMHPSSHPFLIILNRLYGWVVVERYIPRRHW